MVKLTNIKVIKGLGGGEPLCSAPHLKGEGKGRIANKDT